MTHQIYPSNITKLLSAEQYRILTQELVQKVFSSLLVAPPVASPLRAHGAAPSLAAPQRSAEHTDITELQHIILSEYFMIVKKKILFLTSGQILTKPASSSWVFILYSLNIDSERVFFFFFWLRRMFKWIIRS